MIITLILAAYVPIHVVCTNCNGVGYFEVDCPRCSGSGLVTRRVKKSVSFGSVGSKNASLYVNEDVACPDCTRGLISKGKKGTGKKKETCKVCKGLKKIKVKKP